MIITISEISRFHRKWMTRTIQEHWGSPVIVSQGIEYQADLLPGFIAFRNEKPIGLLTYYLEDELCEIVSINAFIKYKGIGTQLLQALEKKLRSVDCNYITLVTTNDNLDSLRFYQKRGFRLMNIRRNAVTKARRMKPRIPKRGCFGIPIRDEIILKKVLKN